MLPLARGPDASPQPHHPTSKGQVLGEAPASSQPLSTPRPLNFHPEDGLILISSVDDVGGWSFIAGAGSCSH